MDSIQAQALSGALQKFQPTRSLQTVRSDQNGGTATTFRLVSRTPDPGGGFTYRATLESQQLGMFFVATKPGMSPNDPKSQQPIQYTGANAYCVYRANFSLIPGLLPQLDFAQANVFVLYDLALMATKGGAPTFADPPGDPFSAGPQGVGFGQLVNLTQATNRTQQVSLPMRGGNLHYVIADEVSGKLFLQFSADLAAGFIAADLPEFVALQGTTAIFWISQAGAVY